MEDQNERKSPRFRVGTPQCGLLFGLLGAALALMLIFLGFWRTLLVALFFAVGYVLGAYPSKGEALKGWINRIFPPKGE